MANNIGNVGSQSGSDFIALQGHLNPLRPTVRPLRRIAVNGISYRLEGTSSRPSVMTSFDSLASAAAVNTAMGDYEALVGTSVTVEDAIGNTFTNVVVLAVEELRANKVIGASDGNSHVLRAQWVLSIGA